MLDDLNIHDDFIDDFWFVTRKAEVAKYYTTEESNRILGVTEGWSGLRTLDIKTTFPELTTKIEDVTDKIVDRMHFYKCDGHGFPQFVETNEEISKRVHRDTYPWAGVIYLWGEAGTYYNGEHIEFKKNRFICYNGQEPHAPMAAIEDRCVIVVFLLDK